MQAFARDLIGINVQYKMTDIVMSEVERIRVKGAEKVLILI
jgi:hypothetical protein